MQTPKSKTGPLGVAQKTSAVTPQTARLLKTSGPGSESISTSPHPAIRTPKDGSPKTLERKSQRSLVMEKKCPNRVAGLESQLTRLEDDLKKAKEQLICSESLKRRAQHEAEEVKKQLEESQQQVMELSATEETRVQELVKISQDRDREWESELQAVQKHHSLDSAALGSAMNEIMRLRKQLGAMTAPEPTRRESEEDDETSTRLKEELGSAKYEVAQLRFALDTAEKRYHEEYVQSTMEIRNAYEKAERTKSEFCLREAGFNAELQKANACVKELREKLMECDTKLRETPKKDDTKLHLELQKANVHIEELKRKLMQYEAKLHYISKENEVLNLKIASGRESELDIPDVEGAEYQNIMKENEMLKLELERETEKMNEATDLAARATEQLYASQTTNVEMEAELRRMKVQLDQWRKAAEAAAAMLSTDNNGKLTDSNFPSFGAAHVESPLSEEMDDESFKSKNGKMLKKFGVLWKKGQK